MGKKDRQLTADELRLWRQAVSGAEPGAGPVTSDPPPPAQRPGSRKPNQKSRTPVPGDVGKHEARAIKRGRLPIEDRIDLHGMTQDAAHAALAGFIDDGAERGLRCVLVITGKGAPKDKDDGGPFTRPRTGVLHDAVPRWLAQPDLARHVIGFQPALPRDGGGGALYVLLRRAAPRSGDPS